MHERAILHGREAWLGSLVFGFEDFFLFFSSRKRWKRVNYSASKENHQQHVGILVALAKPQRLYGNGAASSGSQGCAADDVVEPGVQRGPATDERSGVAVSFSSRWEGAKVLFSPFHP